MSNAPQIPITVVIPVKNEAVNLPHCLQRLDRFAHVVMVDSGSTDGSADIARQHGATVVDFRWNGKFPKKRNWVLRHYAWRTEWVLFLDADEQVTPEFVNEVERVTQKTSCNGFHLTYRNYFMGRLLRYGYPFSKLALLRLGHGEYEHIEEESWSALDMEVHEHLLVNGKVERIRAPIIHHDFKGLQAYYDRHNHYSSWEAARYLALHQTQREALTRRQRLKYRLIESIWFPPLYFLGAYICKRGFLDGQAGFRFALSKMFYFYQINFKIAEKHPRWSLEGNKRAVGPKTVSDEHPGP